MDIWDDTLFDDEKYDYGQDSRNKENPLNSPSYSDSSDDATYHLSQTHEQEIEIEYELEQVYGVPYGKYINRLDTKFFESEEYRQIFERLTPNKDLNNSIYKYSKQSVLDNWGTNKESMFLIDMERNKLIASIERDEDKNELEISYTASFRESLAEAIRNDVKIIAIHNHPNGYPPSLDDISKIAENHYTIAIVAGANGLVYKYYNPDMIVFTEEKCKNYHLLIAHNVEAGFDIDRAYKDVYRTLGVSYDIIERGEKHG